MELVRLSKNCLAESRGFWLLFAGTKSNNNKLTYCSDYLITTFCVVRPALVITSTK
jgi:hypothetical protein